MSRKIRWGILSTARIGVEKVIPAMQQGQNIEIVALASRDVENAQKTAKKLNIAKSYGSYEALLDDQEIEAIYNPLPNHLHVEWTRKAIEKNKHVLCEKPLSLEKSQIKELVSLRDKYGVKVSEAFMVDVHPQWLEVARLIRSGELGELCMIHGFFSYNLADPANIRNKVDCGGGAIWDIGCYPVHLSRFILGDEPSRVLSLINRDPQMKTDRLASVILDYPSCQCTFTVSTQLVHHQKMIFFGDKRKLEVEIPFNAPVDRECRIFLSEGNLYGEDIKELRFPACDQYQLQAEQFSKAILDNSHVPVSLEDAYKNCAIIEAIFRSEKEQGWVQVEAD